MGHYFAFAIRIIDDEDNRGPLVLTSGGPSAHFNQEVYCPRCGCYICRMDLRGLNPGDPVGHERVTLPGEVQIPKFLPWQLACSQCGYGRGPNLN